MSPGDTTVSHSPPCSLFSIPLSFPKYPINYPHQYPFFPSYSAISKWSTGRLPILAESARERKTDVGHNSRRNYYREPSEQNEKVKGKLGVEICEGKHLERELKKWDTWKWRWGLCANSDFSSFFPFYVFIFFYRTLGVTQQNTSVPNPWQMQHSYHLSTLFSPNKRKHLSSLISFPPSTIWSGGRKMTAGERDTERGETYSTNSIYLDSYCHKHLLL